MAVGHDNRVPLILFIVLQSAAFESSWASTFGVMAGRFMAFLIIDHLMSYMAHTTTQHTNTINRV